MQDDFATKLLMALSSERIGAYRDRMSEDGDANLFAHYAWNIALSESLYPSLQILEVVLRNSIHQAVCQDCGQTDWYDDGTIAFARTKPFGECSGRPSSLPMILSTLSSGFYLHV